MIIKDDIVIVAGLASDVAGCLLVSLTYVDKLIEDIGVPHNVELSALSNLLKVSQRMSESVAVLTADFETSVFVNGMEADNA